MKIIIFKSTSFKLAYKSLATWIVPSVSQRSLRKLLEALEAPVSGYASDAAIEVIDLNLAFPLTDVTAEERLELTPPQPLQPDSVAYMRLGG